MRLKTAILTVLTAMVSASSLSGQQPHTTRLPAPILADNSIYSKLPLTFEANRGQTDGQVTFLSRGKGYTAFLTAGGMVLSLRPGAIANGASSSTPPPAPAALQFHLLGANKNPQAVGEDRQRGVVNYFMGNNPSRWQQRVPTYAKVRYKNIYPGIDLIYYGSHQQLEYDFALSPGADARQIQFEIRGADEIRIDNEGNLVLTTAGGELHFQSPIVYQESSGQRIPVKGGYAMKDAVHIGFQVAHYDPSKPLVIDPVLVYSTYLGGSGSDQLTGIAADSAGSVYVAGYTNSANFPSTAHGLQTNTNHVLVAKLDPTGTNLIYADYIGGNSQDYGIGLVIDGSGEVYVTGSTGSSNFPVVKPYQSQLPGPYSGFLTKVSADGSSLLYSTYLGGNTFDQPTGIAIDTLGQVHVAGYTMSQNFPVFNAFQATVSANQAGLFGTYGFLTKFSADGSSLVYSTFLSGNSNVPQNCGAPCWPSPYNAISAVALDTNGNAYVTGSTNTYNFPATAGTYQPSNSTQQDLNVGFISKFNGSGSLGYSSYFYSSGGHPVTPNALAVDNSGSAYVTGVAFSDGTFPITSTSICDPGAYGFGCGYAFVTKFDPVAASLAYSTFLGPNNYASPLAIALDGNNDAYVVTQTRSAAFGTVNALEPYSSGTDVLLVEIDPLASTQLLATYLGGSGDDTVAGLALGANGDVYVAGTTTSVDFPSTQGAFQTTPGGSIDGFIAKIGAASTPAVSISPSSAQFGILPVGSTSQAQTVRLRNMGSSALSISSIATSGDFVETDNCGNSVPAAGACTFSVTFTPSASGSRSGSILISDDAVGSPHAISLNGTGAAANVLLTPTILTFPSVTLGASSVPQAVTLTNNGTADLTINSIQTAGDYSQANNCPNVLAYGASCAINVQFTPTASGLRSGTLTISDNVQSSPQRVSLTGTGADFSMSSSPSQNTVKAGSSATYALSISSVGGTFLNSVSLTCNGLPANATCKFSPAAVIPGASGASSTLTISTTTSSAQATPAIPSDHRPVLAMWAQLQGFGLLGMMLAGSRKRSKRLPAILLLALLILGMLFMSGCAGGTGIISQSGSGQGSGTSYTITVRGSSGSLNHSVPLTLTVQ